MTGSWLSVAAAFGLVALNGFFVATEFALVKVRPTRLDELARRGSAAARRAKRLVEHLDEYLSATQLGITLASLALGWIGEPAFAHLIEPLGTRAGLAPTTREAIAAALSFLLITFLHIVFGELAPKSLAIQRSEGTALVVSAPMRWFRLLFYPAIWALNGVASATLRVLGLRPPSESEAIHTEEELRLIVASMRSSQGGSRERLDLVARTLRLPERVARDLMVSRQDTVYFRLDQTPEERREVAKKAGTAIQRLPGGRYRVDPRTPVADFAHHFGIQIEADSAASVGGLVIEKLRRIPAVGDQLALGFVQLTVEEMDGPRIASLLAARSGGG